MTIEAKMLEKSKEAFILAIDKHTFYSRGI